MKDNLRRDKMNELIEYLLGSCKSLQTGMDACGIDELTSKEEEYLDSEIFLCDSCGWWEEVSERNDLNGDALCNDCLDAEVHED